MQETVSPPNKGSGLIEHSQGIVVEPEWFAGLMEIWGAKVRAAGYQPGSMGILSEIPLSPHLHRDDLAMSLQTGGPKTQSGPFVLRKI